MIIQNATLRQDQKLNFLQIWWEELHDKINYRRALSMCLKTPSVFKQIACLFWAVRLLDTSSPGSVPVTDLTCKVRPCRLSPRWKPQCCTMVHFSNWFLSFGLISAPKLQHNRTSLVCLLELPAFSRKKATEVLTTFGCMKSHGAIVEELTPKSWSNNNSSNLILPI